MPRSKLGETGGESRSHRALLLPYNQIDMCYLRPLSYESLSDQKQKDSPRPPSEQSLYFNLWDCEGRSGKSPSFRVDLPDCESWGVATKSQQDESGVLCPNYIRPA